MTGRLAGLADLHCHLLPGVDDGPATMEESLHYARRAVDAGTGVIVATPHVEHVDVRELPDAVAELRGELERAGIPLHVECGGELKPASVPQLSDQELDVLAHGPPGRRWLLLELPFRGLSDAFHAGADELRERGYTPLLAHPERTAGFGSGPMLRALRSELERGAAIQMNVGPLRGLESEARASAARELLRLGLAHAIATDAHPPDRPYTLAVAREAILAAGAAPAEATRLVERGPRELLERGLPRATQPAAR